MVKQIVRDVFFLGQPSEPATKADIQVGKDLQDTLQANRERCVVWLQIYAVATSQADMLAWIFGDCCD